MPGREDTYGGARSATGNWSRIGSPEGHFFNGPCAAWFRMNHPLVKGETPSPYQRVAVAGDSGNGISAALDFTNIFSSIAI